MYTQQWGGAEHFINASFWVPAMFAALIPLLIGFILWSLVWKGLGLWHAARRNEPAWFVALLLVNTLGILEIIYLFFVAKLRFNELFSKKEHHTHS
ncbi:MAG: DUF5652 family protein [Patescibacteria group bacterium]